MPSSTRRAWAHTRAFYTGETPAQAARGVGRHSHGLDTCTPQQRALRAALAIALFDQDSRGGSRLLANWDVTSARWDDLVLYSDMPEHLSGYFFFSDLRWEVDFPEQPSRLIALHHPDTGGVIHLCSTRRPLRYEHGYELIDPDHVRIVYRRKTYRGPNRVRPRSRPWEVEISPDAQVLLAGVLVRLDMAPDHAKWLGTTPWRMTWRLDPATGQCLRGYDTSMLGAGDEWTLTWNRSPMLESILTALTHPLMGIVGARIDEPARFDGPP